jgi:hypothetical protein
MTQGLVADRESRRLSGPVTQQKLLVTAGASSFVVTEEGRWRRVPALFREPASGWVLARAVENRQVGARQ